MEKAMIIIVPVYNRKDTTQRFVECLKKQTFRDFTLFCFDDGMDGTGEMVRSLLPAQSVIFKGDGSWYWGGALREAFRVLKYQENKTILLANDDVTFNPNYLEIGNSVADGEMLTTTIYQAGQITDGGIVVDWKRYKVRVGTPIDCASTRGLFLTLDTWRKVGNINRFLPMHGDYDFTLRAKKKGINIRTLPDLVAESTDAIEQKKKSLNVFSTLHYMNPIHHTITLLNHCPIRYLPLNLARIWGSTVWKIVKVKK